MNISDVDTIALRLSHCAQWKFDGRVPHQVISFGMITPITHAGTPYRGYALQVTYAVPQWQIAIVREWNDLPEPPVEKKILKGWNQEKIVTAQSAGLTVLWKIVTRTDSYERTSRSEKQKRLIMDDPNALYFCPHIFWDLRGRPQRWRQRVTQSHGS